MVCLLFSGCFFLEYSGPSATEMAKSALLCFDNNDVEGLKSLFCEEILSDVDNLDKQIEEAFELYEGKCVNRGGISNPSSKSYRDGKIVLYNVSPLISDIETDEGKKYDLKLYTYTINEKYPQREGIYAIDLYMYDENGECSLVAEIGILLNLI